MSLIRIQKIGITDLDTDAIVNAANEGLWAGDGVCGAVFKAAGHSQLQKACNEIGHCDTGSAVITPGFQLKAKYIIHAVGPVWSGGKKNEPKLLYSAYRKSLEVAVKNGCKSIGFPLLSAGIFGFPKDLAWRKAIQAVRDFLDKGNQIDVVFAVISDETLKIGEKTLKEIAPMYAPAMKTFDTLLISGQKVDAVFFHKPEEPYGFLSNWYPSPFDLDGSHFSSNEQYIMYNKCLLFGDDASAKAVLATEDVSLQQKIGKEAKGYLNKVWAGKRQLVAVRGLLAKFSQNEDMRQKLEDTGDAWLVECAHSDTIWACGWKLTEDERFDASKWLGQNILGFALMEVRAILRNAKGGQS